MYYSDDNVNIRRRSEPPGLDTNAKVHEEFFSSKTKLRRKCTLKWMNFIWWSCFVTYSLIHLNHLKPYSSKMKSDSKLMSDENSPKLRKEISIESQPTMTDSNLSSDEISPKQKKKIPVSSPPRMMSATQNPIYFIHIGKTGGTSVDILMMKQMMEYLQQIGKRYVGGKHFDWSFVEEKADPDVNADIMTFLRDPVTRVVSQFHFSKKLSWAKRSKQEFMHQSFEEYVENPKNKMFLDDGMSGSSFLAGSVSANGWVKVGEERKDFEHFKKNMTATVLEAARNLDRTVYFGLLEDVPRSMEMLKITLNLDEIPKFPKSNNNVDNRNKKRESLSPDTISKIQPYIPGDIWLYEYAKLLFEARWDYVMKRTPVYVHPKLPPLPEALQP